MSRIAKVNQVLSFFHELFLSPLFLSFFLDHEAESTDLGGHFFVPSTRPAELKLLALSSEETLLASAFEFVADHTTIELYKMVNA